MLHPITQSTLSTIYTNLSHNNWSELFQQGWQALEEQNTPKTFRTYKALFIAGGALATPFILGSFTFACLALAQGIEDIQTHGSGPIIGHFSEWSMQSVMTTFVVASFFFQIAKLGFQRKIHAEFDKHIGDTSLDRDIRKEIYKDKLEYLKIQPQNTLFSMPQLPNGSEEETDFGDELSLDSRLNPIYRDLEKKLKISGNELIKKGWKQVLTNKGNAYKGLFYFSVGTIGTILFLQYCNYSLGIYWSAEQAISDGTQELNPSIGGHCLEWFAEMVAVANMTYQWFSELANVGMVKHTVEVFQEKITQQENVEEKKRLREIMDLQIHQIAQGYFFSLPYQLKCF